MHFDGWNTMEGRHLVLAYAAVLLLQGGYFAWVMIENRKMTQSEKTAAKEKATKPF